MSQCKCPKIHTFQLWLRTGWTNSGVALAVKAFSWIVQCLVVAQTRGVWVASEGPGSWKSAQRFVHTDRVCDFVDS